MYDYPNRGSGERRTKIEGVTSSDDKRADSSHHATVLIFIAEIGRNYAENGGARVRWHLVTICEICVQSLEVENGLTVNNCV